MTPDEYQGECTRTWTNERVTDSEARKMHAALGLASEAGELAGAIIKSAHYGKPFDRDEAVSELGDALWYLTILAYEYHVPLSDVMETNIAKLQERHPDGFSREKYQPVQVADIIIESNGDGHVYKDFS